MDNQIQARQDWRWACLLACALLLCSCFSERPEPVQSATAWAKPYPQTTCTDWLNVMDSNQRAEMAAFYLDALSGHRAPPVPIDPATFQIAISDYCVRPRDDLVAGLGDRANLIQIAAGLQYYLLTLKPAPSRP
jgi:hypothetical protein